MTNSTFIVFLRGINVGNRQVQMAKLRAAFEKLGLSNVRTVLATGNIVFESTEEDAAALTELIENGLEEIFGFSVKVILRTKAQMQALLKSDPFKGIKVTPDTRLYVSFLSEPHASTLPIPYVSPEKEFRIIKVTDREVISVLVLSPETRTVEAMAIVEKEFGKNTTTRNWNTVEKVVVA